MLLDAGPSRPLQPPRCLRFLSLVCCLFVASCWSSVLLPVSPCRAAAINITLRAERQDVPVTDRWLSPGLALTAQLAANEPAASIAQSDVSEPPPSPQRIPPPHPPLQREAPPLKRWRWCSASLHLPTAFSIRRIRTIRRIRNHQELSETLKSFKHHTYHKSLKNKKHQDHKRPTCIKNTSLIGL